jgi:hypothetical protein
MWKEIAYSRFLFLGDLSKTVKIIGLSISWLRFNQAPPAYSSVTV